MCSSQFYHLCRFLCPPPQIRYRPVLSQGSRLLSFYSHTHLPTALGFIVLFNFRKWHFYLPGSRAENQRIVLVPLVSAPHPVHPIIKAWASPNPSHFWNSPLLFTLPSLAHLSVGPGLCPSSLGPAHPPTVVAVTGPSFSNTASARSPHTSEVPQLHC